MILTVHSRKQTKNGKELERKLRRIIESVEALELTSFSNMLRELVAATEEFDLI